MNIKNNFRPYALTLSYLAFLSTMVWFGGTSLSFSADTTPQATNSAPDYFDAGKVAFLVSRLIEKVHFSQKPFDQTINKIFLNDYYDSLDPFHMVFLDSDITEFNTKYQSTINDMTKGGDVSPATQIHQRYLDRLKQWEPYIDGLLSEKMDFTQDETYLYDRHKEAWPKDETEAKDLWRKRIKYEILETRLADYENQRKLVDDQKKLTEAKGLLLAAQNKLALLLKQVAEANKKAPTAQPADKGDNSLATQTAEIQVQIDQLQTQIDTLQKEAKLAQKGAKNGKSDSGTDILEKKYSRRFKDALEEDPVDVVALYLSALTMAYDPHSEYQAPEEAKNFEIQTIKLSLSGIGAVLTQADDGAAEIVSLVPGGPADKNKQLKPKDHVVAVRQEAGEAVNVVGMRLNKVVDLIRGPKGTKVTLTIVPADSADTSLRREVTILRDDVNLEDARATAKILEHQLPGGQTERLGVVNLPGFYDNQEKGISAAEDTAKLINRMKTEGVTGLIIDMRRNGGGLLDQAIKFTALFVKDGPVVQVKDTRGSITPYLISDNKPVYGGPLLVMTSRLSASAAEIVAAALQDYGRAILVGDKTTHGKGTVQQLFRLREYLGGFSNDWDPGQLKATIQKFYRIGGKSTQLQGVEPEIVLPSIYDYVEGVGEASLPNALPCDQIPAASFKKVDSTEAVVPYLIQRSEERTRINPDFGYLNEQIELQKKRNANKSISLNETTRRTELDQLVARSEAIKSERKSRKPSLDRVYSLDVDMVEANKPLKLISGPGYVSDKKKDGGAEVDADLEESSDLEALDMHLSETMNILQDYILGPTPAKVPSSVANVVSKPST